VRGPDWWALVELLGPQTACNFIPIPEIKSTLCSPLGQALAALADFADGEAKAIGKFLGDVAEVVVDFTEDLAGQSPPMPPEEYYKLYWYPRIHWYLMSALVVPGGGPQGWPTQYENCVTYFDNRKASKATAQKLCGRMRSSAQAHFEATLPAIKAAPAAYLAATLRPQLPRLLITYFEPQPGEQVKLAEKNWPYLQPFDQLYSHCVQELKARIPVPGTLPKYEVNLGKWNSQPDDAWKWACNQAMLTIAQELNGWRLKAGPELLTKMASFGCKRKVDSGNPKLYLECETFEGYDNCSREITAHGVPGPQRCQAAQQAGAKFAAKVATELGTKRCAQTPGYALIRCTRPWKVAQCLSRGMPPDDAPAGQGARLVCELKDDPQFTAAQQQVQQILFKLNGGVGSKTDALGTTPGEAGPWKGASEDNCRATWDPLAIRCKSDDVLASHQVSLPKCPLFDLNLGGADQPCAVQPSRARTARDAAATSRAVPAGLLSVQPGSAVAVETRAPPQRSEVAATQAGGRLSTAALAGVIGQIRPTVLRIEAEGLLRDGAFQLRGGQVVAQPMSGFGPGWGGNAQLFWHGGAVGAVLDLMIDVPQDGAWVVEIDLTRAPDYGQLAFEVDQHPVAAPFDGYAPGVVGPVTVTLGTFAMRAGRRPVSLMITGRNPAATGFLVGIDRILLKPSGG
jgi:hypothetical protein